MICNYLSLRNKVGIKIRINKRININISIRIMIDNLYLMEKYLSVYYIRLNIMKRKQGFPSKQNKESISPKTIQYLQKKYEDEKKMLEKQIKQLQKQLHQQIDQQNMTKLAAEKKEQKHLQHIKELEAQVQSFKRQLLIASKQRQPDEQQEQEQLRTLEAHKQVVLKNNSLTHDLKAANETIMELQRYVKEIESTKEDLESTIEQQEQYIQNFKKEITNIQQNKNQLLKQIKLISQQLQLHLEKEQNLQQVNVNLQSKLAAQKKKKKELQRNLQQLQEQINQFSNNQIPQYLQQIAYFKEQQEELQQTIVNNKTATDFLNLAIKQKDNYIEKLQREVDQLRQQQLVEEKQHHIKIQALQTEIRKCKLDIQTLKCQHYQEIQNVRRKADDEINEFKQKMIQEVYTMLRGKDYEKGQRILESLIDGTKGSYQLTPNLQNIGNQNSDLNMETWEKSKYQTNLRELKLQISKLNKNNETLNIQLSRLKKVNEELQSEIDEKGKKIQQLVDKKEKNQKMLNGQILQMRNQLSNIKGKETQLLQLKKWRGEFQNAMTIKAQLYEKKYRDLIENNERKQSLLEKNKHHRIQAEEKNKLLQQRLGRALQEIENLKRVKADCQRKDDLVKEYKTKIQKMKSEIQFIKGENENLKKDKNRLQNHLESKEQYISSIKIKHQRQIQQFQGKDKDVKLLKENKNAIEAKSKKLKKQCNNYCEILQQMREILMEKVIQKSEKANGQQKSNIKEWEGAKLLGLKPNEIEQFINPLAKYNKNIVNDLESIWLKKDYSQFILTSVDFLTFDK